MPSRPKANPELRPRGHRSFRLPGTSTSWLKSAQSLLRPPAKAPIPSRPGSELHSAPAPASRASELHLRLRRDLAVVSPKTRSSSVGNGVGSSGKERAAGRNSVLITRQGHVFDLRRVGRSQPLEIGADSLMGPLPKKSPQVPLLSVNGGKGPSFSRF